METSQDYAMRYFESGFIPVPVPLKEKAPRMKDWPNWRPKTKDALLSEFGSDPRNVGVLLGQASGGLVDLDLDCPQAVRIAGRMLPKTGFIFGRESSPRSHWIYRTVEVVETTRFRDPTDGGTLVECRAEGAQTIFPGSVHPSGEKVVFFEEGEPVDIAYADLQKAVKGLASASLLAKHWL